MNKFKRFLKNEMDVEIFACLHWVSIVWCYAFFCWLQKRDGVSFAFITEMGIVGYLMSISQRILFGNEKFCRKMHPVVRNFLWVLVPVLIMIAAQFLCGWFDGMSSIYWISFDITMFLFLAAVEWFIHKFYEDDTEVLNDLLKQYKNKK